MRKRKISNINYPSSSNNKSPQFKKKWVSPFLYYNNNNLTLDMKVESPIKHLRTKSDMNTPYFNETSLNSTSCNTNRLKSLKEFLRLLEYSNDVFKGPGELLNISVTSKPSANIKHFFRSSISITKISPKSEYLSNSRVLQTSSSLLNGIK
jgi:hypothetical protein